jgi:hypothetical protein
MPEKERTEEIESLLSEQKVLENRKQDLFNDLLKRCEAAMANFDATSRSSAIRRTHPSHEGAITKSQPRRRRMAPQSR